VLWYQVFLGPKKLRIPFPFCVLGFDAAVGLALAAAVGLVDAFFGSASKNEGSFPFTGRGGGNSLSSFSLLTETAFTLGFVLGFAGGSGSASVSTDSQSE
jgi:hypothetical protein